VVETGWPRQVAGAGPRLLVSGANCAGKRELLSRLLRDERVARWGVVVWVEQP